MTAAQPFIPLRIGIDPSNAAYNPIDVMGPDESPYPPAMADLVTRRDCGRCRFCGYPGAEHLRLAALDDRVFDTRGLAAACIFCWATRTMDRAGEMRAGIMIQLPEFSQVEVVRLVRDLYLWRVAKGPVSVYARSLLNAVVERRAVAIERYGSNSVSELAYMIANGTLNPDAANSTGLRYLPFDRLIVNSKGAEYNRFPQVFMAWRMLPHDPVATVRDGLFVRAEAIFQKSETPGYTLKDRVRDVMSILSADPALLGENATLPAPTAAVLLLNAAADHLLPLSHSIPNLAMRKAELNSWRIGGSPEGDADGTGRRLAAARSIFLKLASHNPAERTPLGFVANVLLVAERAMVLR